MSQDIPETQLCELAGWFRALAGERRRLLKRYRASRLKAEALDAGARWRLVRVCAGGDQVSSTSDTS
ncbi:unnamed protein product [Ascophyllum nodosum]